MTHSEEALGGAEAKQQVREADSFPVPESVVRESIERAELPGLALGILNEDVGYVAGFGVTSVDNPLPVDADTLFQIGSITKTFTATAVMCLVEQGKLDLDRPIRAYLPEFHLADDGAAAAVSLRHLLSHSGGWWDTIGDTGGENDDALAQLVVGLAQAQQMFSPGSNFSYSNSGISVAGRVLEAVTAKTFEEVIKELILDPLGMDRSFFRATDVMTYRFAVGHHRGPSGVQVMRRWHVPRNASPAGGVVTSVRQLVRYARFQLGDGTTQEGSRLLSAESMQAMRTPQNSAGNLGLTWHLEPQGTVWHSGSTFGQHAMLQLLPDRGFAFLGMANAGDVNVGEPPVLEPISTWAFKELLGVETLEPEPIARRTEDLLPYVGTYEDVLFQFEVRGEGDGGGLAVDIQPKRDWVRMRRARPETKTIKAVFVGDNEVMVVGGPQHGVRGEFLFEDGTVRWLRWRKRLARRVD